VLNLSPALPKVSQYSMIYDYLKILHIISASLVLGSILYSYQLWITMQRAEHPFQFFTRIQKQTALIIVPATLIQLATGFTLISLQHYPLTEWWIGTSIVGFVILVTSWLAFVWFLAVSLQHSPESPHASRRRHSFYRHAQSVMLLLCGLAIALMIFSMANRFTGSSGPA